MLPLPCVILVLMHDDSLAFCVFPAFFLFSFVHLYAKFMRYCVHVCRSVFGAFSRLFRSGRAHVLSCSKQVLARAKSLIFTQCICVVFFPVRFALLIKFCVHLKRVHLLASIFHRFYVVALVGVAPFCSRSPPLNLLLMLWICNARRFLSLPCVFSWSLFFLSHNKVLLFLSLVVLVFCGRAGKAGSVRFCLSLPCSLCLLAYYGQYRSGVLLVVLFLPFLRCFLLLCCSAFYFAFSWCLPPVANVVAWAPVGTLMPSSRVPRFGIEPLRPSPPSMHHLCTSGLVCVSVARVHVCSWQCAHVVRPCACVFAVVFGVQMCVLGVLCVSRDPKPNLEPGHKLFCTIFNLNEFFCVDQFEILRFLHKLT